MIYELTQGSLRHGPAKRNIFHVLCPVGDILHPCVRERSELRGTVGGALAGRAGKDALVALANVYRDYAREHPGRYAAAQFRLGPEAAAASAGGRHAQMTRAILRGYDLAQPDRTHAVRMLGSVFHGYVSLEMAGGFGHSSPGPDETWPRVLDALDALLRNWPADGEAKMTERPR